MKYCPLCERSYGDEVQVCQLDGATLREGESKGDPFIGQMIKGRYQVIKKLGEGGMGTVYLAEQVSIGRKVALKVLHGRYAQDEEFVRRFRHEARLAAALNHRNVITVYDFDQGEDGSLFIAMEYVDGRNLSEVIREEGPLDVGRAVRLGIQIAEGLGAAHRTGVIHRDIKPENIMIVGSGQEVKLMDFGIARLRDTGAMTRLTRSGVIMGTPAYMSPEQIEGREVTERTDLYAFGIVLYEMLSGGVPFRASTPGALLMKHLREMPVPVRKLRTEVPSSVEQVVMQALEKKPQRRQKDMEEVAQGLRKAGETLVEEEIPETLLTSTPLGSNFTVRLSEIRWKLLGTSTLLLVLGIGGIVWVGSRDWPEKIKNWFTPPPKPPAVQQMVSLRVHADKRELKVNERVALRVKGKFSDGSEKEIKKGVQWRSSNDSIAAVNSKGLMEAWKAGYVNVTASYKTLVTPPLTLMVKGPTEKARIETLKASEPINGRIKDHIEIARFFRQRGEYSDATSELEKASSIDPANKEIKRELEITRKACIAEKRVGRAGLKC